jgi:peptidoglycan/xylan/chitin deacetylase (PgdA/CDA1 family)
LDRLVSLYVVRPWRSCQSDELGTLPILMYHGVSHERDAATVGYYQTVTRPEVFAAQMAWLRTAGYQVVSARQALGEWRAGKISRTVALTFDDGFRDFATTVFPILRQHGFAATVFLPTAFVGDTPRRFQGRECLTWSEVQDLSQAGIEFGSHTVNHPKLCQLGAAQIQTELTDSKAAIEQRLGKVVDSFAYPYAFPSEEAGFVVQFVELLQRAGFQYGVTTRVGRVRHGDSLLTLKRLPINTGDDSRFLASKLSGAYDWVGLPQDVVKRCKRFWTAAA